MGSFTFGCMQGSLTTPSSNLLVMRWFYNVRNVSIWIDLEKSCTENILIFYKDANYLVVKGRTSCIVMREPLPFCSSPTNQFCLSNKWKQGFWWINQWPNVLPPTGIEGGRFVLGQVHTERIFVVPIEAMTHPGKNIYKFSLRWQ